MMTLKVDFLWKQGAEIMCGRYQVLDEEIVAEMKAIIDEINRRHNGADLSTNEIYPTNIAPVITADGAKPMRWGYPGVKGSRRPVINARQETAATSPYFKQALSSRRIVIPTAGFYEWMHQGKKATDKYLFKLSGEPMLYLAAIYTPFDVGNGLVEDRFAILTTDANESMVDYHNRMPVYLSKDELEMWVNDPSCIDDVLKRPQPQLSAARIRKKEDRPKQLSMF